MVDDSYTRLSGGQTSPTVAAPASSFSRLKAALYTRKSDWFWIYILDGPLIVLSSGALYVLIVVCANKMATNSIFLDHMMQHFFA